MRVGNSLIMAKNAKFQKEKSKEKVKHISTVSE
jgi:hypothetical protein